MMTPIRYREINSNRLGFAALLITLIALNCLPEDLSQHAINPGTPSAPPHQ